MHLVEVAPSLATWTMSRKQPPLPSIDSLSFIAVDSWLVHSVHNTLFNVLARCSLFTMLL